MVIIDKSFTNNLISYRYKDKQPLTFHLQRLFVVMATSEGFYYLAKINILVILIDPKQQTFSVISCEAIKKFTFSILC